MISLLRFGRYFAIALPNERWLVLVLLLVGAAIRINGVDRDSRLHADEALFASYGRQLVLFGDWNLYAEPIDKPPTTFALVGTSLALHGNSELAVRLPNLWANILSLAVLYRLAKTFSDTHAALFTLLVATMSPLDIAFAPTVFQDPPMLLAILLGILLLLRRRWMWGGFWLGFAFCIKPTAIYLFPLGIGLALLYNTNWRWQDGLKTLGGLLVPIGLLVVWDESRLAQSFFTLGNYNNNPGRFIRADEILPRAGHWLDQLMLIAPTPIFAIGLLIVSMIWLVVSAVLRHKSGLAAWWIAAYSVAYVGWHWLIAFPVYDRYVLPLVPFSVLIAGQGLAWIYAHWRKATIAVLAVAFIVTLRPATAAIHHTNPATGQEIDTVSRLLATDYQGQIVYDYSLGWQLRWYLGQNPSVLIVYFPTPEQLAIHMQNDKGFRYLIAPDQNSVTPWVALLAAYGIHSRTVYDQGDVVLIELTPPRQSLH